MGTDGLYAYRNFRVENERGDVLIKASSMWLMVNTETRRLVRPGEFMQNFPLCTDRLLDTDPEKILPLEAPTFTGVSQVSFTETDMNMHTNNVSYIERIINAYDFDFLMKKQVASFSINFIKEAVPGDLLKVGCQQVGENEFINNIVRADGTEMVRTRIVWR